MQADTPALIGGYTLNMCFYLSAWMDSLGIAIRIHYHRYYRLCTRDRKQQINPLYLCPPSYAFPVYIWQLENGPPRHFRIYTVPRDTSTVSTAP
jgi:hypothetical protein